VRDRALWRRASAPSATIDIVENPTPKSNRRGRVHFYDQDVVESVTAFPGGSSRRNRLPRAGRSRWRSSVAVSLAGFGTHQSLMDVLPTCAWSSGRARDLLPGIAWRMGFISAQQLEKLAQPLIKSGYGEYLLDVLKHEAP
jgi:glucose-1-phosphate thymidylyltransferase